MRSSLWLCEWLLSTESYLWRFEAGPSRPGNPELVTNWLLDISPESNVRWSVLRSNSLTIRSRSLAVYEKLVLALRPYEIIAM